ncbi:hypothetical protein CPB83DRAFT_863418 [Crepidotus variabilis]|uniref:MARVEL domain-containing protein n=1 Tax=Crepidotus variabilis TaxID=179855 RepID=A0A9P6E5U7_9AGAR|nr:hypothetical protein CPB83DRAFT_863418 [Crepidotus variabilis]
MAMDAIVRRGHPVVFGLLVLFAIIELCITAFVTAKYNSHHNYPNRSTRDRVRYLLFLSVWTTVFGAAFLGMFLVFMDNILVSVASHFVFLIITWILWLAAAAAFTSSIGGALNCHTQSFFVYCGQLNAIEGFAWLIWVVITLLLVFVLIRGIISQKRGDGVRGGLVA